MKFLRVRMLYGILYITEAKGALTLLTEDEVYVITRHFIDGIDIPRVAAEYQKQWGNEYAKTDRTIKTYQRRALDKIEKFEQMKQLLIQDK